MPRKKSTHEESSGAEAVQPQNETGSVESSVDTASNTETHFDTAETTDTTPSTQPLTSATNSPETPSTDNSPVMERLRQKAREEAENGSGAPKGSHPYDYTVTDRNMVPEAFRDENYDVSDDKIQINLQDAWDHNRNPVIPGLMIGRRD